MNSEHLKFFVENNGHLVSMKETSYPGVYVLKYKRKVFYDNLWNDFLEECRGTLVDADFNIISYPFTKIYNYGIESKAPVLEPDTPVEAYRKVNGFMAAVTWHNGDILVSTTGSTDSPFVEMAQELIEPNIEQYRKVCKNYEHYTFMFECVHRNDPHIIPEQEGMYLLGIRAKLFGSPISVSSELHKTLGCFGVERVECTINELQELVKTVRHEGFVFYTEDGVSAKIKSPYYLTNKWVARNPRTDKIMDLNRDIKKNLDEEYYPLVDAIRENIVQYTKLDEQARLAWCRKFLGVE